MNEKDFLQQLDELYKKYAESNKGEIEAFLLKEGDDNE